MGWIYTFVNQKGGVGKTTSAINLAAYLAKSDKKVLIVDIDPQANATSCLGVNKHEVTGGTYDVLIGKSNAKTQILHSPKLGLYLLPSSPALVGAEIELIEIEHRESRLRNALHDLIEQYDYILIDCPPSLSLLTLNGIVAAKDGVIVPVQCEYLALEGLSELFRTLARIRQSVSPGLRIRGILLTMYDARTNLSEEIETEVRDHFKDQVFRQIIPRNIRLAEAPSHGVPISAYDPKSIGAAAYQDLALEILRSDNQHSVNDGS